MEYKDFFSPKTLEKLNKKSAENLKTMLGDKNLMQTMMSSQQLLSQISKAEAPYKAKLEKLAVDMVKELYPIIDQEGIVLDAKIGDIASVTGELDEIKVNKPIPNLPEPNNIHGRDEFEQDYPHLNIEDIVRKIYSKGYTGTEKDNKDKDVITYYDGGFDLLKNEKSYFATIMGDTIRLQDGTDREYYLTESISPESRRRIINAITQGAALRGAFAFYLFKEHLDELDPSLVEKYNQIMKNSFGIYDDENAIAMMLSLLAQGQKMAGGSSKVIINEIKVNKPGFNFSNLNPVVGISKVETDIFDAGTFMKLVDLGSYYSFFNLYGRQPYAVLIPKQFIELLPDKTADHDKLSQKDIDQLKNLIHQNKTYIPILKNNLNEATSGITIRARAINFPMLVHELIKGLYELISLQGFKGSKEERQAVVDKVDLLKNEPSDLRYGKFIYDALNNIFVNSEYNDPRIREFFFTDVYQLEDDEFISFIENAINEELTSAQQKWANDTLRDIASDLKADDYDATGLDEIKVNKPGIKKLVIKQNHPRISNYGVLYFEDNSWIGKSEWDSWARPRDGKLNAYIYKNYSFIDNHQLNSNRHDDTDIKKLKNFLMRNGIPSQLVIWHDIPRLKISNKYYNIINPYTNETKIEENKSFKESFLESIEKTIKTAIENKTINPNNHPLLKEYSEKTITTTIERWKATDPNTDENVARQLIQRFDQIKSGLAQKLDIVVLPDELKKGNNYLNIDKYSYEDIVNLIRSLPENPEKVKKDAIKKFVEKEQIDRNTAQSYVARFIANKDKLKFGAKEGLEDEGFTEKDVLNYIPKRLQQREAFLDPRNWDWDSFEQMLDALFPSQKQAGKEEENLVSTDADKIYNKDGIEIYKGDDVHKCISYNPVSAETKRKKYGWCVTQVGNTNYDYYRFGDKAPTFYFVFDRSKDSSPEHSPFNDEWHAFVIQVTADNKEYIVTGANNRGDIPTKDKGWEGIANIVPADTWAKIKGLKDYFKPINLSAVERGRKFASGKNLSVNEFKELSQDEKILYIQGKASKNQLTPDILAILPQYKINLEGRSTTLANVAIDSRQKFPYSALKDNEALAKRYAVVSSRYYPNDPLPLPFIKYLDEDAKEKYLAKYDENLTFEYIEKYFGPTPAEKYVNEQAKKLDYLPQAAFKYIKDPQLKQLYFVYSKLFDSWKFDSNTNISEEELDNRQRMPEQSIVPTPMDQKQWSDLTTAERKVIIGLTEKYNKNTKYLTLLYALPFIIENKGKKYVLLPKSNTDPYYESWVLMDENGKIVKDNISGEIELAGSPLNIGYPDEETNYNRIYDIKNLTK